MQLSNTYKAHEFVDSLTGRKTKVRIKPVIQLAIGQRLPLQVEFHLVTTGSAVGYGGFLVEFHRFKITENSCACNKLLYNVSSSGEISSPSWPKKSNCHNMACSYLLHAVDRTKGGEITFDKVLPSPVFSQSTADSLASRFEVDVHDKDYIVVFDVHEPFNEVRKPATLRLVKS